MESETQGALKTTIPLGEVAAAGSAKTGVERGRAAWNAHRHLNQRLLAFSRTTAAVLYI